MCQLDFAVWRGKLRWKWTEIDIKRPAGPTSAFAIHARMTRLTQPFDPGHLETPSYLFTRLQGLATLEGNKRRWWKQQPEHPLEQLPSLSPNSVCVYLYLSSPGRTLLLCQLGAKSQQELPIKEARADAVGIRKSIHNKIQPALFRFG